MAIGVTLITCPSARAPQASLEAVARDPGLFVRRASSS